jgi:hypothetical protein
LKSAASDIFSFPTRRRTWKINRRRAGPEQKALERKRGARTAVCQNGRDFSAMKRNAVTVWMPIAKGIERKMIGMMKAALCAWPV